MTKQLIAIAFAAAFGIAHAADVKPAAAEVKPAAAAALRKLDRDGDGRVTLEEMRPRGAGRPEGGPPRP